MDKFEHQFENLDVQSKYMEASMGATTTMTTPMNEVDSLMHQVADEAGLELKMEMPSPSGAAIAEPQGPKISANEQNALNERLAKLRFSSLPTPSSSATTTHVLMNLIHRNEG